MKKTFLLMISIYFFIFPFYVYAETCNPNSIVITSIELKNSTSNTEEIETSIENNKINIGAKLKEVGDSLEYEVKVSNNSNEEYVINNAAITNSNEYIDYKVTYEDNSNIVQPQSTKYLTIKVEYKEEVPDELLDNNSYTQNKTIVLNITNEKIENPKTGNYFMLMCSIILSLILIAFSIIYKKHLSRNLFLIGLLFIPTNVLAICNTNLECEISLEIIKDVIKYPHGKTKETVETGDIVTIGTEEFYVVKHDGNNLVLLAHYNLKVGNIYDSEGIKTGEFTSEDEEYGIQSIDATGRLAFMTREAFGSVFFSRSNYWNGKIGTDYPGDYCTTRDETNCAYVYDSNSNLYSYIETYKNKLEEMGATIIEARLMSLEEGEILRIANSEIYYERSYWLGTAFNNNNLWIVSSTVFGSMEPCSNDFNYGIRPAIVI